MGSTTIEWTNVTWNPVVGCSMVSAGCAHCYAERMSVRLHGMAEKRGAEAGRLRHYLPVIGDTGRWSGKVALVEEALADPAKWKTPRLVFVNSMSDLFHEDVPLDYIRRVFAVMRDHPQHTFQVLTKRSARLRELAGNLDWPANGWMGVSVANRDVLHRVDDLRAVPAAIRFLSCEPLIGSLCGLDLTGIAWVIGGGESGPGARPMRVEWAREVRDAAAGAGVAFFFKQWGAFRTMPEGRYIDGSSIHGHIDKYADKNRRFVVTPQHILPRVPAVIGRRRRGLAPSRPAGPWPATRTDVGRDPRHHLPDWSRV